MQHCACCLLCFTQNSERLRFRLPCAPSKQLYERPFAARSHNRKTRRTAFRRFDRARDSFAAALDRLGLDEATFRKTYLTDPAVAAVCARIDDGEYFTAKSLRE